MPVSHSSIDFVVLDDVMLAEPSQKEIVQRSLRCSRLERIGPLLEYTRQQPEFASVLPLLEDFPDTPAIRAYRELAVSNRFEPGRCRTNIAPRSVEFSWIPTRTEQLTSPAWIAVVKRLEQAARAAGFRKNEAAGVAGAVREMADNAIRHSERPESACMGYQWQVGNLEYAVVDSGIGVLASLSRNPVHAHLADHGDALKTALTEGESRFGSGTGHGLGFRQLFVSLADLQGHLRFRSGDHRLVIEGSNPSLPFAQISQTAVFKGFMVSVACRTPS